MKTLEKHLLILEPLLAELAPLGWFRKGRELWFVDRKEGYALCIHVEMYMNGTYKNVFVHYGSFWNDVKAGPYGVSLGSSYWLVCNSCIPFDTIRFETAEELESIVRRSAPILVDAMKEKVLPILRTIRDLPSFVAASGQLDKLLKLYNKLWRCTQAWDYFALGRPEDAMAHLDRLIEPWPWRERYLANLAKRPPEEQEKRRSQVLKDIEEREAIEQENCAQLAAYKAEIAAIPPEDMPRVLQERRTASEAALAAHLGPRRWKALAPPSAPA